MNKINIYDLELGMAKNQHLVIKQGVMPDLIAWIKEAEDLIKHGYWGEGWTDEQKKRLDILLAALE